MESNFGNNLRFFRKREKITLEELSSLLGISKSSLSDYETRKTFPPLDVCRRLVGKFGYSIDQFDLTDLTQTATLPDIRGGNPEDGLAELTECRETLADARRESKLRGQQVEGLRIQLKLQEQLIESKNAEIQALRIQIYLLEEKIRLSGG
jgi:transcriptional regulator with XRE-family HTH domain